LSKINEFVMSAVASNLASLLTVPPAVVTGVVPGARGCGPEVGEAVLALLIGGAASTKAEGGNPPMVCESAAFKA